MRKVFVLLLCLLSFISVAEDRSEILKTSIPDEAKAGFNGQFRIQSNDKVVLVGGGNFEFEDRYGRLEYALRSALPKTKFTFRNISWEGDTVFNRQRDFNHGSLQQQLSYLNADIVIVQYGQMEIFGNEGDLAEFEQKYKKALKDISSITRKIVVVSPFKMTVNSLTHGPDLVALNSKLKKYTKVIQQLADSKGLLFVDVTNKDYETRDGIHLTDAGHKEFAHDLTSKLIGQETPTNYDELICKALVQKNYFWREFYRPENWAFAYGDRMHVAFSQGFQDVARSYKPLIEKAEMQISQMFLRGEGSELDLPKPKELEHSEIKHLSPEDEANQVKFTDPNFKLSLFASEEDGIINPVRMKWDRLGRLWVCCVPSYPQPDPGQNPQNYIIICEDTDKDGKADKFIKFSEDIPMPMGIEFDKGGAYVCEGPDLVYYEDKDFDGKPESKKIILSGFGTGDSHQNINSINWGHDGQLWFTQGYHAFANVETVHGVKRLGKSGVFRYNPRTGRLRTFFGKGRAGLNNWGTKTDNFGETIHVSGADPALFDTSAGAVDITEGERQPRSFCFTRGRKKCDMEPVHSLHFPEKYQGQLWTATFYSSQVNAFSSTLENGAWRSKELPEVIIEAPAVFRPLEIKAGPQGELFILDWYNEIIGHYQASYKDPRRDKKHGRIWRLTYKGRPLSSFKKASDSISTLIENLKSDDMYLRRHARGVLFSMKWQDLSSYVTNLKKSESPKDLACALNLLQAHEQVDEAFLKILLSSESAELRKAAVLALGRWFYRVKAREKLLEGALSDIDPRVRVHAIVVASESHSANLVSKVYQAASIGKAWTLQYSAKLTAIKTIDNWLPALSDNLNKSSVAVQDKILDIALSFKKNESLKILRSSIGKEPKLATKIQEVLLEHGNENDYQTIANHLNLLEDSSLIAFAEAVLKFKKIKCSNSNKIVDALKVKKRFLASCLAAQWKLTEYKSFVMSSMKNFSQGQRIHLLANSSEFWDAKDKDFLVKVSQHENTTIANLGIQILFEISPKVASEVLLTKTLNARKPKIFLAQLIEFPQSAKAFAEVVKSSKMSNEKSEQLLSILQGLGFSGEELVSALKGKMKSSKQVPAVKDEAYLKMLVSKTKLLGNVNKGKAIYNSGKLSCVACHKIGEVGGVAGPALGHIGKALPLERVIESIIWPSVEVKEGFSAITLMLKDNKTLAGYLQDETPSSITLKNHVSGKVEKYNKLNVTKIVKNGSLMPANLLVSLSFVERLDLFAYVASLGKKPASLSFEKNKETLTDKNGYKSLFNGKSFDGWEGDLSWFRIEEKSIVAGNLNKNIPHNFFLTSKKKYYDFELHFDFKVKGSKAINGGFQFRSSRIPNHYEMIGYQADIYENLSGNIYDESRRRKFVNTPIVENAKTILKDDWNHYVVRCEGNHVKVYLNGWQTADYHEKDKTIASTSGLLGLQIHGGPAAEVRYKNLYIKELGE